MHARTLSATAESTTVQPEKVEQKPHLEACAAPGPDTLDTQRTELAYAHVNTGLAANTLVAAALAALLWQHLPSAVLGAWLGATLLVTGARAVLTTVYRRSPRTDCARWRRWLAGGAIASGITWGLAGMIMPAYLDSGHVALLAFVLAGMAAAGLTALATMFGAYLCYLLVLTTPIAVWLLGHGDDVSLALGCMAIVFSAAMTAIAHNYTRSVGNALGLAHQNSELIDRLSTANRLAANANQSLEAEIAEREMAESAVRDSESRFRDFAELGADLFWELDSKLRYVRVLGHCKEVLGLDATSLIGKSALDLGWSQVEDADKREAHLERVAKRQAFVDFEYSFTRPDGHKVVLSSSGKPTFAANGAYIGYRGVARNITEAHSLSQRLQYQASHDALTGLLNRTELERRLRRVIDSVATDGSSHALCFLDMDQFKVVNDTCGHSAGDELLREVSEVFKRQIRGRDTLARLGGDEFALLLEHCSIEQANRVVNGLLEAVSEYKFQSHGRAFQLGASIGVVPITGTCGDLEQLMSDADSACYAAKEAGRNRVYVCREGDEILRKRQGEMQWVSKITQALEQNQFCLYAQAIAPIRPTKAVRESVQLMFVPADKVAGPTTSSSHFEVLLRMVEADGSTVPPGMFLPAAEQYNLSPRLDRWVIGATFDWLIGNPDLLRTLELCSINLSGNSLGDEEFGAFVIAELERTGVPAEKICFEITETAAIGRIGSAAGLIKNLKEFGFQFALDDFGSGLSSFGYLKSLPVDYLKIDGLFIRDITDDPIDFAMVKSINEIGQVMGKRTVAEFVENDAILEKLRDIGVDFAQGYGIGKPVPIGELG